MPMPVNVYDRFEVHINGECPDGLYSEFWKNAIKLARWILQNRDRSTIETIVVVDTMAREGKKKEWLVYDKENPDIIHY